MATTPLADAKNRLSGLVASAEKTHERIVITKNGRPVVAIISLEDLEGMEETLEILSDPDETQALRQAIAETDLDGAERYTSEEMRALLEERRQLGGRELSDNEADTIITEYRRQRVE